MHVWVAVGRSEFICTLINAILMIKRLFNTLNQLYTLDFSNARTMLFVRVVRAPDITERAKNGVCMYGTLF